MEISTTSPSRLAFQTKSGWIRYAVALSGTLAAVGAMASYEHVFGYVEAGILALAAVAMIANRVDAHVFVRASLWGALSAGALAVAGSVEPAGWVMLVGSALALIALGTAGLDSDAGPFSPRVLRRTLVTMMVVGLSVAHVFAITAVLTEILSHDALNSVALELPSTVFTRVAMFGTPLLMVLGVMGLSRTKSWGLFAYLGALVGVALTIGLSFCWVGDMPTRFDGLFSAVSMGWVIMMSVLWAAGAALAFGTAIPVLTALFFRRRPSSGPSRFRGAYAHAALVCVVAVGAVLLRYG